ncbi:MAG TPA: hypothetical protein VHW09_09420 [Bryobacteraceae bacterium]|jgi:hypothetical protein|nr:hypothetical protein [Bryobacteraceae bacterium]
MAVRCDDGSDNVRIDRAHFSVARLTDADDSVAYWLSQPVEERLRALERLRRVFYGDTGGGEGLSS